MDRRNFIKKAGIGLGALLFAGQVSISGKPDIKTPIRDEEVPEGVSRHVYNTCGVDWYLSQSENMLTATVRGIDPKTNEDFFCPLAIPLSEIDLIGWEATCDLQERMICMAMEDMEGRGIIPL